MLKSTVLQLNILFLLFIFNLLGLSTSVDSGSSSHSNKSPKSKANVPNPTLKGLTNIGSYHEEQLQKELGDGKLKHEEVNHQRVKRLREQKKGAEKARNEMHKEILHVKKRIRKGEPAGRFKDQLDFQRNARVVYQGAIEDIRFDAKAHKDAGNFSNKDYRRATKMEYPRESRKLGYNSDGHSKGSSFGPTSSQSSSYHSSGSSRSSSQSPEHSSRYRSPSPPRRPRE